MHNLLISPVSVVKMLFSFCNYCTDSLLKKKKIIAVSLTTVRPSSSLIDINLFVW